jgi:hypothetical protein
VPFSVLKIVTFSVTYGFFPFAPSSNNVFSVKKWSTKHLRKLENHINALAVNLVDNSETTHRLKRYTVLTLPDRSE